jgi:hypothetical protein
MIAGMGFAASLGVSRYMCWTPGRVCMMSFSSRRFEIHDFRATLCPKQTEAPENRRPAQPACTKSRLGFSAVLRFNGAASSVRWSRPPGRIRPL